MPQIIVAGVLIYLYYLLMSWLIGTVAPEFLVVASAFGTAGVPFIYANAAFKTMHRKSWRAVFWMPVAALLVLISIDLAYLVVRVLAGFVSAQSEQPLLSALSQVVYQLPGNRLGIATWVHVFGSPAWWGVILIPTAIKGVAVVGCLLVIRGFSNDFADGKQSAFRQYFFGQALLDLKAVWEQSIEQYAEIVQQLGHKIFTLSYGPQAIAIWPLTVTAYLAMVAPAIAGLFSLAVLLVGHFAGIAVACLLAGYISALLFCVERAVMSVRRGFAKCPHAGCHAAVPLAIYYCPGCGAAHDRLIPGRYGVFARRCSCGAKSLPTTAWLGRNRLRCACPQCKKPLQESLFTGSAHIPIYGATSAGKTMLMMAATWQLVEGKVRVLQAEFVNPSDRRKYDDQWRANFERGILREKTHQLLPDAFMLSLRRASGFWMSLYMYDPAGEAIEREQEIEGHRFLRYFDGMALAIDPMSLPSFVRKLRGGGRKDLPLGTSEADPLETVHRIVNVLESQAGLRRERRYRRKLAVIVTKGDLAIVQKELGLTLDAAAQPARWRDAGLTADRRLREWFSLNEPALFQALETRFSSLRFFFVSALGHDGTQQKGFLPQQVLLPFFWLLSKRATLTHPKLARFCGTTAETLAGFVVCGLFVIPSLFGGSVAAAFLGWSAPPLTFAGSLRPSLAIVGVPSAQMPGSAATPAPARLPVAHSTPLSQSASVPFSPVTGVSAQSERAVVTAPAANLRAGPSTKDSVIRVVQRGETYPVLERRGQWVRVGTPDTYGWLHVSTAQVIAGGR